MPLLSSQVPSYVEELDWHSRSAIGTLRIVEAQTPWLKPIFQLGEGPS